jgi:hypothetical protein
VHNKETSKIIYRKDSVLFIRGDTLYAFWIITANERQYYKWDGTLTNKDVYDDNVIYQYNLWGGKPDLSVIRRIYYKSRDVGVAIDDYSDSTRIAAYSTDASFNTVKNIKRVEVMDIDGNYLMEWVAGTDTLKVGKGYVIKVFYR